MIIITGRTDLTRELGTYHDFCPICKCMSLIHLLEVRDVGHLYFIPLGSVKSHGLLSVCHGCETPWNGGEEEMERLSESREEAMKRCAGRLALRDGADQDQLTPENRRQLILEAHLTMRDTLHLRKMKPELDGISGLALGGVLLFVIVWLALIAVQGKHADGPAYPIVGSGLILLVPGAAVAWFLIKQEPRRFARRVVYPRMATAIGELNPTLVELEEAVEQFAQTDPVIARLYNPAEIQEAIQEAREREA